MVDCPSAVRAWLKGDADPPPGGSHRRRGALLAVVLALVLLVGACGDDGGDTTTAPSETPAAQTSAATDAPAGDDDTTTPTPIAASESAVDRCEALFGIGEVAALFGEDAFLEEATEAPSLGQLYCSWSTVEDPDDLEDLASELLIVQLYTGDPVSGREFWELSLYEDAEAVPGIGDEAFISHVLGTNTGFLDGDVAGFLGYASIDFADTGAGDDVTDDVIIDLLRTFHDRAA